MFPGGAVSVVRTNDGDYWVHVAVANRWNDPQGLEFDHELARITDARLDITGKHASQVDAGDFKDPGLYHLAVRVTREDK